MGDTQILRNDNLNIQKDKQCVKEDIIKELQTQNTAQTRQTMVQMNQSISTSRYQVIEMSNTENVFIEKIVTDDDVYKDIENALDAQVSSSFKSSDPIYFQDAILKRYVDSQNNIISLLGYVSDANGNTISSDDYSNYNISIINLNDSPDFGIGEIHQNIEGNLQVIYKDEYANNLIKSIIEICNAETNNCNIQSQEDYSNIAKYFSQVGYNSCEQLIDFLNMSSSQKIAVNSVRFGQQSIETRQIDRVYVQLNIDNKLHNLLIKLDPTYKVFDTDLI